ncbi:Nn.00g036600.m01.CDS01 [Neocucurbitaria sp. VM-36]
MRQSTLFLLTLAISPALATVAFFLAIITFYQTQRAQLQIGKRLRSLDAEAAVLVETVDRLLILVEADRRRMQSLTNGSHATRRVVKRQQQRREQAPEAFDNHAPALQLRSTATNTQTPHSSPSPPYPSSLSSTSSSSLSGLTLVDQIHTLSGTTLVNSQSSDADTVPLLGLRRRPRVVFRSGCLTSAQMVQLEELEVEMREVDGAWWESEEREERRSSGDEAEM